MRKLLVAVVAAAIIVFGAAAPAAAKERVLTLYSPKINSLPYVHDTHQVALQPDGKQAPAEAGYITGWKEMALVDSKDPKAKPLPIAKMMVHHFLYFAPGHARTRRPAAAGAARASSAGAARSTRSAAPRAGCPPRAARSTES